MEFRILGPLEVANGVGPARLQASKQRALLGVLLLHPNEVVATERLIDELWGERPPATAVKIVQTYVSQLRRALGPQLITTRPPGYQLRIEENALDAARFRRLAAEGRRLAASGERERADAVYGEALALWRGPPLADVVFESFARNEVEQLEEERLGVIMERIDCRLALGQHDELVAELETLVKQHPLRERLHAQLILALYRSGRQADALAAYRDARRILVEQLGLEPSRELHQLEQAILVHDPGLKAPARPAHVRAMGRRLLRWRFVAGAAVILLAVGLGLAFAFRGNEPAPKLLPRNSVGFIDADSGRVTRSFPVGREPRALAMAYNSLWAANYHDQTVTRLDRGTGRTATIVVGGHPTGLAAYRRMIWVATFEGRLVPIDPRFNSPVDPIDLSEGRPGGVALGEIAAGGGFLWVTAPATTIFRLDPARPDRRLPIIPNVGTGTAIAARDGDVWGGGTSQIFRIATDTGIPGSETTVGGVVRDLVLGDDSLWVVSGRPVHAGGVVQALRRVDVRTGLLQTTITVGDDPVAVAAATGSIWVASRDGADGTIYRVSPTDDRVVDTIRVGAIPIAIAADTHGVWVATK